jgi:hypothetical protein
MGKHSVKRKIWREIYRVPAQGVLPGWLADLIIVLIIAALIYFVS